LLELTGLKFVVEPPDINESKNENETPREHVERLAQAKAASVAQEHPDAIILACDTAVILNGRIVLGKPENKKDAKEMLEQLAGKEHTVVSAVAAIWLRKRRQYIVTVETKVRMKQLEDWEIQWYLGSGEPLDKAGAYAIQGRGSIFIEGIVGSYTNVVGLPLMESVLLLRSFGIKL
ncbi:MAG: nucleoside triphosphate pyrophosphatase, partial [bacterium]